MQKQKEKRPGLTMRREVFKLEYRHHIYMLTRINAHSHTLTHSFIHTHWGLRSEILGYVSFQPFLKISDAIDAVQNVNREGPFFSKGGVDW